MPGANGLFCGWSSLRPEDCGPLLEHITLDLLRAILPGQPIHFWRDKQQREVDFVIPRPGGEVTAIECKWSKKAGPRNLDAFRSHYPNGRNLIVCASPGDDYETSLGGHRVRFCGPADLPGLLV